MDPTIAGALLGVGAAIVGFGASAWQTRATLRANRQAAQDQRLWEKRSTLYERMLASLPQPRDVEGPWTASFLRLADVLSEFEAQATAYASGWVLSRYSEARASLEVFPREVLHIVGFDDQESYADLAELEQQAFASKDGPDRLNNAATGVFGSLGDLRGAMRSELLEDPSRLNRYERRWRRQFIAPRSQRLAELGWRVFTHRRDGSARWSRIDDADSVQE
jgi:hypothetical protein